MSLMANAFTIDEIEYTIQTETTVSVVSVSSSLTDVVIPEAVSYGGKNYTVTAIKSRAFNSSKLLSVTIPGSVLRIEDYAFNGASNLKELYLLDGPDKLNIGIYQHSTYYNVGMFRYTSLATLYLGREYYTTYYNEPVSGYDANPFYHIPTLKNVTIGNIKNIHADCFFSSENIENVDFGSTLETISGNAFNGCEKLTSIILPNTVKSIDYNAFAGCRNVTSIYLGNSIESIGNDVFTSLNCDKLTLPKSLKSISWRAFVGCKFENIFIEDSETELSIWDSSFRESSFKTAYQGRNISNSYSIFSNSSSLEKVEFGELITQIPDNYFKNCTSLSEVTFSSNLLSIGNYAFAGCVNLNRISFPEKLYSIGLNSFQDCKNLLTVNVNHNLNSIGDNAFNGCISLCEISLQNCTSIGKGTFKDCNSLKNVILSDNVTVIPDSCFYNCTQLLGLTFPKLLTTIKPYAFTGCSNLQSLNLPATTTNLGDFCFKNTGITTFEIPLNVTTLPTSIFEGCGALSEIHLNSSLRKIEDNAFAQCKINKVYMNDIADWFNIQVSDKGTPFNADGSTELFVNGSITNEIKIPSNINRISSFRFYGMALNKIVIPESITVVDNNAFKGIHNLNQLFIFSEGYIINNSNKLPENNPSLIIWCNSKSYNYVSSNYTSYDVRLFPIGKIGNTKSWICGYDFSFEGFISSTSYTVNVKNSDNVLVQSFDSNGSHSYQIRDLLPGSLYTIEVSYIYDDIPEIYSWQFETKRLNGRIILDKSTQTTLSIKIDVDRDETVPTIDRYGSAIGDDLIWWNNENYQYSNLNPNCTYTIIPYVTLMNKEIPLTSNSFTTKNIVVDFTKSESPTSVQLIANWDNGDADIEHFYFEGYEEDRNEIFQFHLKPNSKYDFKFYLITSNNYKLTYNCTVRTTDLLMEILPVKVINLGEAIVAASTNCANLETNVGFQWRKYDAPDALQSSEALAIVYDDLFEGIIKNLQYQSYYKVRAFFKDLNDNYYFSDWITFDPSDFSYFSPTVKTWEATISTNGSVNLMGYAIQGSNPIINQGFEYWNDSSQSRSNSVQIVYATGQIMSAQISDLLDGDYSYRAFVETSEGTTYGDLLTFTIIGGTGNVEDIIDNQNENSIIGYFDLAGQMHSVPQKGFNIILYKNGKTKKILIK